MSKSAGSLFFGVRVHFCDNFVSVVQRVQSVLLGEECDSEFAREAGYC